jgi:assimilatory nitrate reductase catalytic subunit
LIRIKHERAMSHTTCDNAQSPAPPAAGGEVTPTHCPYCAFQCGMELSGSPGAPLISGDTAFPVNAGILCVKGYTAGATLAHRDRITSPLVRNAQGTLEPRPWDDALDLVARRLREVQDRHGRSAVGVFGSGALTNEKAYLLGKLARVALGTPHVDYNGRFCMSSAAAASLRAFGLDRGLPFPLEDVARTDVLLLAGANPAETLPPMMRLLDAQRARGGRLVVVDPRRSPTADAATLHLRLAPGTDAALANGILHVLVRDGLIDREYVESRTEGFGEVRALVAAYWPERVERITGVPEAQIVEAARLIGRAPTAMVLTGRGPEQQAQGVNNVLAYIDVALALGLAGRPFSGYGCLTGQGNGQGGREHGQKADQLPGYRRIDDPAARRHIAGVWGVREDELPGPGRSAYELLASMGEPGGVRALLVVGSNPLVSAPDALRVEERLRRLDFLAVADFFLSETAAQADVVLPSAQWAEEEGTMTNLEGRVIRRRRAFPPPPGVKTDLEILCALAERLGAGRAFAFSGAREVFEELRRASAGGPADYAGISYEKIDAARGVFWPCPTEEHPGTPRLFAERFATPSGRARFHAVKHGPPAEEPDGEYPLFLTTGRLLAHYQSGAQTRRVAELVRIAPEATAHLHPATARRHALVEGDGLVLVTRRGRASFRLKLDPGLRPDTVFVPFHWGGEHSVNRLTHAALDPTSRMPEFKVCAVRVERAGEEGASS